MSNHYRTIRRMIRSIEALGVPRDSITFARGMDREPIYVFAYGNDDIEIIDIIPQSILCVTTRQGTQLMPKREIENTNRLRRILAERLPVWDRPYRRVK